jgi:hypothetical protein
MIYDAMIHYYWSVICKTEDCHARHLLSYIGTKSTFTTKPATIQIQCFDCGQTHSYADRELKLYPSGSPPVEGFEPKF